MSWGVRDGGVRWTYLFVAHVEEVVEPDTAVAERAERPLLLELSSESGVGNS